MTGGTVPAGQSAGDPDASIAALRYLQALLDPQAETFMVPGTVQTAVVGGELVVTAPADMSAFVRALGLAALDAMFASARFDERAAAFEDPLAYVTRLIDVSIEAHTLEALAAAGAEVKGGVSAEPLG